MSQPTIPVGFDYARAMLEIRKLMTYEEIAACLGYENAQSVGNIINGRIPNHPQGEALFVLYRELFGCKPPMTEAQAKGIDDFHKRIRLRRSATA